MSNYQQGFKNFTGNDSAVKLDVDGQLPAWLQGSYVRTGPGSYPAGLKHWFDGYALLTRFIFENDSVWHQAKFLESTHYQMAKEKGCIAYQEFGTQSEMPFWWRLFQGKKPRLIDNCLVNIIPTSKEECIALTETPSTFTVATADLSTLAPARYLDKCNFVFTLAHPHYDSYAKKFISIGLNFGVKNYYHIYSMDIKTQERDIICSIPIARPGYQHSFSITENYIVLIDQPLRLNPIKLAWQTYFGKQSYYECYRWQPEQGTRFFIIEKSTGKIVQQLVTDSFFMFHTINAYEVEQHIVLDMHCYSDNTIIDQLFLSQLEQGIQQPEMELRRYRLPLLGNTVDHEILSTERLEFGRIHYAKVNGCAYRYFYSTNSTEKTDFMNQLVKYDLEHNETKIWQQDGCYCGEPVFVPKPNATNEDDGVVLDIVLDTIAEGSFLLVLDAITFSEIARIKTPHIIPFGFHGNFSFKG
ncbi:MAG: carotenoid oxygenase family protein [Gammaproteobacteria bacterium]|nr:carotenoid oxygenase family protein [Gammaproteobacteria bacterium]